MTDSAPIEAVCFDLDDTLFDFTEYVRAGLLRAADHVEERTGLRLHDELVALYFEEGVTSGTFDRLVARHVLPPSIVPDLVEAYHDNDGWITPYPGARAVLDELGARYRLGLLTDGRNGREKLARLGLADRFDAVVVAHGRDFSKPDPEAFERVLDHLGVEPAATVYVGDHPYLDVYGAKRLGMRTVRLRRGRYAGEPSHPAADPDLELRDLDGLLDLLAVEA